MPGLFEMIETKTPFDLAVGLWDFISPDRSCVTVQTCALSGAHTQAPINKHTQTKL